MTTILYTDNHLLVANKPAGISTQPHFEEECRQWLKETKDKNYLHVMHRIDRPVSGIVICACSNKALTRLSQLMKEGGFDKHYLAIVSGSPQAEEGILEHYLFHDMERRKAFISKPEAPFARKSLLSYKKIHSSNGHSWLSIRLKTGRYHQIRAQLSAIGCPILGDDRYGSTTPFQIGAIALHHASVSFMHPARDLRLEITAPLPSYWKPLPNNL